MEAWLPFLHHYILCVIVAIIVLGEWCLIRLHMKGNHDLASYFDESCDGSGGEQEQRLNRWLSL